MAGARPNFVKVAPVIRALEAEGAEVRLVHTGQHYDDNMSGVFFRDLGISAPGVSLGVGGGTIAEQVGGVLVGMEPLLRSDRPDLVVVVGDVNSTLGAAIAAAHSGALLAHVEAGLRSHDWTMPEEINRVAVDRLSDLLYAPSADAVSNLQAEGYRRDQIVLVGNVMVDSLLETLARAPVDEVLARHGVSQRRYGLVTLHRPSLVDDVDLFRRTIEQLEILAEDLPLLWPVHPRAARGLGPVSRLTLLEPLGYLEFVALQSAATFVITDSGGVQEETTALGVPCLTYRDSTERPVTVTHGSNRVIGCDPSSILPAAKVAIGTAVVHQVPPLWDGKAAERIAAHVCSLDLASHARPTDGAP